MSRHTYSVQHLFVNIALSSFAGPMKQLCMLLLAMLVLSLGSNPTAAQPHTPTARHGHRLIYDTTNKVVLLFGGKADDTFFNDTWAWDGTQWSLLSTAGPSPRAWFGFAYDAKTAYGILHGGRDSTGTPLGDTWHWHNTTWTRLSTQGPVARDHHGMAYDPLRNRTLLFGGYDRTSRSSWNDTWAWDGETWMRLSTTHTPEPRDAHALVFAPHLDALILFGGMNVHEGKTTIWGDTWRWDGRTWHKQRSTAAGRSHFAMAYDATCACMIRFGGGDPSRTPQAYTWKFGTEGWSIVSETGPSARVDHAMVLDTERNHVVLFGGYVPGANGSIFGDTWEWDGTQWIQK